MFDDPQAQPAVPGDETTEETTETPEETPEAAA